jgi:hypothetical protein
MAVPGKATRANMFVLDATLMSLPCSLRGARSELAGEAYHAQKKDVRSGGSPRRIAKVEGVGDAGGGVQTMIVQQICASTWRPSYPGRFRSSGITSGCGASGCRDPGGTENPVPARRPAARARHSSWSPFRVSDCATNAAWLSTPAVPISNGSRAGARSSESCSVRRARGAGDSKRVGSMSILVQRVRGESVFTS